MRCNGTAPRYLYNLSTSLYTSTVLDAQLVEEDLKDLLTSLARHLFGANVPVNWREDYFPFTEPSFELDAMYQGDWMEVLGCGIIHRDVLNNAGCDEDTVGWAFGLGLERLAMVLFSIPDIRLFWSQDERFLSQFKKVNADDPKTLVAFQPYSKYPFCYKDVSFWLPTEKIPNPDEAQAEGFHVNDVYEVGGGPCS